MGVLKSWLQATLTNLEWREVATQGTHARHHRDLKLRDGRRYDGRDGGELVVAIVVKSNSFKWESSLVRHHILDWQRDYTRETKKSFISRVIFFVSFFERAKGFVGFYKSLEQMKMLICRRLVLVCVGISVPGNSGWRKVWPMLTHLICHSIFFCVVATSWRVVTHTRHTNGLTRVAIVYRHCPPEILDLFRFVSLIVLVACYLVNLPPLLFVSSSYLPFLLQHSSVSYSVHESSSRLSSGSQQGLFSSAGPSNIADIDGSVLGRLSNCKRNTPVFPHMGIFRPVITCFFARLREREYHSVSSIDDRSCQPRVVGRPRLRTSCCTSSLLGQTVTSFSLHTEWSCRLRPSVSQT